MASDAARLHQLQGTVEALGALKELGVYGYSKAKKSLLEFAKQTLDKIDNPTFISTDEKNKIRSVIAAGDYETTVNLIGIKTDEYARSYLDVTGLMTRAISTVASNYSTFQVCD
jgi:hypothetical protein